MDPGLYRVFPPYAVIRLHLNFLYTVQGNHVEFPNGFVVLRRVSCCHDNPALGNWVIAEGLALKKLKHGRGQSLGYTVDFVDEQNSLAQTCFFHFLINRSYDFAHSILGNRFLLAAKLHFRDKGQSDGALARVVGDGISYQTHAALSGYLLHDLSLADTWRAQQQNRALAHGGDNVVAVFIF